MTLKLSVIIVNYQSTQLIADCLNSAFQFASATEFEWIIVNNDLNAEEEEFTKAFPFVKWINMGYNSGFARANNEGMRNATADMVLLLNPDMIINDNAINRCYERIALSNHSACSLQLINRDGTPQITGSYFMMGALNILFFLPYLGTLIKNCYSLVKRKGTAVRMASTEQQVDWINGAFMMIKKAAIEKAGLMDEDFFLYSEEVEWCYRLKKTGEIVVYGDITSIHLQGASINSVTATIDETYLNVYDKKGLQLLVSRFLRVKKQFGNLWFLFHMAIIGIEIPIFIICSMVDNLIRFKSPFYNYKDFKGYTKNVFQVWKLIPNILSGKPYFYKMF